MTPESTYGTTSRINHWIIAIAMIGMLGLGLFLEFGGLEREAKGPLRDIHKAIGVLVLFFGLWRVVWRLLKGFPAAASNMPAWQATASQLAHWVLLAGIVLMPLSGLFGSIFSGRDVSVFGFFTLPGQAEIGWLQALSHGIHSWFGKALAAVVVVHIAAAMKHHLIDKDATLMRMLKGTAKDRTASEAAPANR